MKQKVFVILFFLFLFDPLVIYADHGCIDAREYGQKIIVGKNLPTNWFKVGDKQITDRQLHDILKTKYKRFYTSGIDGEGFSIDHFCGIKDGIYISIFN